MEPLTIPSSNLILMAFIPAGSGTFGEGKKDDMWGGPGRKKINKKDKQVDPIRG